MKRDTNTEGMTAFKASVEFVNEKLLIATIPGSKRRSKPIVSAVLFPGLPAPSLLELRTQVQMKPLGGSMKPVGTPKKKIMTPLVALAVSPQSSSSSL